MFQQLVHYLYIHVIGTCHATQITTRDSAREVNLIDIHPPILDHYVGKLIVLKYAYPREVEENPDYHSAVTAHFLSDPPKQSKRPARRCQSDSEMVSSSSGEHSLSSSVEEPPTHKETPSIHSMSVSQRVTRCQLLVLSLSLSLSSPV